MQIEVFNRLIKDSSEDLSLYIIRNKKVSINMIFDSQLLIQSIPTFSNHPILHNNPSLLCCAAYFRAEKCFALLIKNGAQMKITDFYSTPITHFAVVGNSLSILQYIHQLILNKFDSKLSYKNSIFSAIEFGTVDNKNTELCQWLYSNKYFTKNDVDDRGYSLVQCAIEFDQPDFLKFFVDIAQCQLSSSFVPLCYAFRKKSYKCIEFLLEKYQTFAKTSPSSTSNKFQFSIFGQNNNLDINQRDQYLNTALHYASKYGNVTIVQKILDFPLINVSLVNRDGKSPIDLAANEEIKELITKKKNEMDENMCQIMLLQKQKEEERMLREKEQLAQNNQNPSEPVPIEDNTKSVTCLLI